MLGVHLHLLVMLNPIQQTNLSCIFKHITAVVIGAAHLQRHIKTGRSTLAH